MPKKVPYLREEQIERDSAALLAELQQDLAAAEKYAETHGSFGDMVRVHYETDDGAI